jgi:protein TonB
VPIVTPVIGKDDLPDFDTIPFEIVSNMPSFPGGEAELFRYLSKNISYPEISKIENSQGKVHLSFIVEKDGTISNVHVLLGVDKYIDKEAIRVIELMPNWIPGEQMGEKVRVRFQLPLNFKLL